MILFYEQNLQLPSQYNHENIVHLEIIHFVSRICVVFHHSDLYQVWAHVVGESPTFGWIVYRNWYENHKLLSPS